jgi:hypothetical protein
MGLHLGNRGGSALRVISGFCCAAVPGEGVDGEGGQVGELVELVTGHGEQRIVGGAHAVCPLTDDLGEL